MVLITGATGFLGRHLLKGLIPQKDKFSCLVRRESKIDIIKDYGFSYIFGDLNDYSSLEEALVGKDTIINLASLGFGHAYNIIRACQEAGVGRGIFISTTAIFTTLDSKSKKVRLEAEELIKNSGIRYTILRPTMMYGTAEDKNISRLVSYIQRHRIIPVFGSGKHLQQPVYVEDLANAIVRCLESPSTINKIYNLAGKEPLTYNQIIDEVSAVLDRKIFKLRIPFWLSLFLVNCYGMLSSNSGIKPEQVLRLGEDKAFSYQDAARDFGFSPISFRKGIEKEIMSMYNKKW